MSHLNNKPVKKIMTLDEFAEDIMKRRVVYEAQYCKPFELPRNSGTRRTESKKALLKAIKDAGGKW